MNTIKEKSTYYKYRSLDNFKFLIDIILNNRLYAAKYSELNDIREGIYSHDGTLEKDVIKQIKEDKIALRICSLSKSSNIQPMWTHYANNHTGIAIGIKLNNNNYLIENVDYTGIKKDISGKNCNDKAIAKKILSCKEPAWQHEDEVRIFKAVASNTKLSYINIRIAHIILGSRISDDDRIFLKKIINRMGLNIPIFEYDEAFNNLLNGMNNDIA